MATSTEDLLKKVAELEKKVKKLENSNCNSAYKCERCSKHFKQKIDFTRHMNRKNKCKLILPNNKKEYKCTYCMKMFSKTSNVSRHLNICKNKKMQDHKETSFIQLLQKFNKKLDLAINGNN